MLFFEMSGISEVLPSTGRLLGRRTERAALDRVLGGARDGRGAVLVLHGEAGVGKTALLDDATEAADDFRIARISGMEGEMDLPFAAVQKLCSPFLELAERLPHPHGERLAS